MAYRTRTDRRVLPSRGTCLAVLALLLTVSFAAPGAAHAPPAPAPARAALASGPSAGRETPAVGPLPATGPTTAPGVPGPFGNFGLLRPGMHRAGPLPALPAAPAPPRFPPVPRRASEPPFAGVARPGLPPPNIDLSGNGFAVITTNTTVGSITLSGNATLVVVGSSFRPTLTVEGNVVLSGNSLFYLNTSNLRINASYNVEYTVQISGNATLAVGDSNVTTNGYQWGAELTENANLTVIDSLFCYPLGWTDLTLLQNASVLVAVSYFLADVILFDNPIAPSTAHYRAVDAAGFNVWLNFKTGTRANLTLPGLSSWQNWSFPGNASTSGVGYSVNLSYAFVQVFAVMLWQGANLTLRDSPDVAVALMLELGTVSLDGLEETHYPHLGLYQGQLALTLWNTSVFTWNVYPFGGSADINGSQIGEIQVYNTANATVTSSNLTGHGGYYGDQGSGSLAISGSTIEGQVVGSDGATSLTNCSFAPPYDTRVLAVGPGSIFALNVSLGTRVSYQAISGGTISVAWAAKGWVTRDGSPAPFAQVEVENATNGTLLARATANATGVVTGPLVGEFLTDQGPLYPSYRIDASLGVDGAAALVPRVGGAVTLLLDLLPLVEATSPANGTTALAPANVRVVVDFQFPMNVTNPATSVDLTPALANVSWSTSWAPDGSNVTFDALGPLPSSTTFTVTVAAGSVTTGGIPFAAPFSFGFTTADAVAPTPVTVTTTVPADEATGVPVAAPIVVNFDTAMNASTLTAAFGIVPGVSGSFLEGATSLSFAPTGNLSFATTYTVTLATSARSAGGDPLEGYRFTFTTANAPGSPGNGMPNGTGNPPARGTSAGGGSLPPYVGWGAVAALIALGFVAGLLLRRRRPDAPIAPPPGSTVPAPPSAPTAGRPPEPSPWDEGPSDRPLGPTR